MTESEVWETAHKYLTLYIYGADGTISHTITNSDIKSESLKITQILESGKCLSFMGCNAGSLKVDIIDLPEDVRGCRIKAILSAGEYSITVFDGVIEDQENETHEDILTSITAYDWMYSIKQLDCTAWAKNLSGIIGFTPLWLMQKFYSEVISVNLPTVTMDSKLFGDWNSTEFTNEADFSQYDSITGETMMKWICQVGNIYGYMNGSSLAFKRLRQFSEAIYPSIDLYPSTDLYPHADDVHRVLRSEYISLDYEPYKVAAIDSVCICDGELGLGFAPGTTNGSNCLYIDDNPFALVTDYATLAADIYARVKEIVFTPLDIECHGMPYIELGESIRASTKKRTVYAYILKRTLKGIQALRDEFESDSEQYQTAHTESYSSVSSTNNKKILRIQADQVKMEELVATKASLEELEADKAELEELISEKATIKQLESVDGKINTLSSKAITTDNLSAQSIDAGQITSGRISTDHLATSVITTGNLSAQNLNASKITTGSISLSSVQVDGQNATWAYVQVTGSSSTYWTYVLRHS